MKNALLILSLSFIGFSALADDCKDACKDEQKECKVEMKAAITDLQAQLNALRGQADSNQLEQGQKQLKALKTMASSGCDMQKSMCVQECKSDF